MSLSQKTESADEAWPKRLRDLMHELDWSGERTAKELGVTVTWVSKLRSGKGTFSDAIKRQITNLERLHLGQLRESSSHTVRDVDATAAYGSGGKLESIIRQKVEILLRKAASCRRIPPRTAPSVRPSRKVVVAGFARQARLSGRLRRRRRENNSVEAARLHACDVFHQCPAVVEDVDQRAHQGTGVACRRRRHWTGRRIFVHGRLIGKAEAFLFRSLSALFPSAGGRLSAFAAVASVATWRTLP
jgi:transcriptional regulator with XRE-family HTH domain